MSATVGRLVAALGELGHDIGGTVDEYSEVTINDVEHDSRRVSSEALFACIRGEQADGHDHAAEAVRAGAVALLCDHPLGLGVPELSVADVREAVGPVAAEVHGRPSERLDVVGVTGTNGKTTTVRLVSDVLAANGWSVLQIGTLTGALTTPEATDLQRQLAQAVERGNRAVAMEVSSHALDLHRVDGCRFRVAAFTNLGRDHLDHHGTMEAYFAAKARLFEMAMTDTAVVDVASAHGRLLADTCTAPVVRFDSRDIEIISVSTGASRFLWRGHVIDLPIGGLFNISNAVLAAEIAVALGLDETSVARALAEVSPIPGRFEAIDEGQPFAVLVDYAHTPDGLEAVLAAARELTEGRITVVFGAGGDRDREKRPRMGAAARELADRVVVTSDNPRGEDPDRIIAAIISGMETDPDVVQADRRLAIRTALVGAGRGDTVVIAGKGHEPTQTTGAEVVDFDDRDVARQELRRLAERAS